MVPQPPLNGEFMGESSPPFEWEDTIQKLQVSGARGGQPLSESSAEVGEAHGQAPSGEMVERPVQRDVAEGGGAEAPHHDGDLTPIGLVLNKLAAERD